MKKTLAIFMTLVMLLGTFAMLPVFAADGEGWDGKTATMPEGKGTENDPYIIASAENLAWVRAQVPAADRTTNPVPPAFEDMYLEQVCDIDLNGKNFSSIGFYYSNTERMGAFAGTYNGNGYKITNGTITSHNSGHDVNPNWGHGLFGMIYGATIKNVVLENVTVKGNGLTGAIVGRAVAPEGTTPDGTFNTIEGCVVRNVTMDVAFPVGKANGGGYDSCARAGGVCGMAYGTTIRNCTTENVTLTVPAGFAMMGGILGSAGFGCVIDHCVSDTDITVKYGEVGSYYYKTVDGNVTDEKVSVTKASGETAIGGIVGFITPYKTGTLHNNRLGGVQITNCYNMGGAKLMQDGAPVAATAATYWGGILGGVNSLGVVDDGIFDRAFYIGNCYNSYPMKLTDATYGLAKTNANLRIGGIIGSGWCGGGANVGTLYFEDCLSVDVEQQNYAGTNEFRSQVNVTAAGLQQIVPLGLNAQVLGSNDTYTAYAAKANVDKTLGTLALNEKVFELVDGKYVRSTTTTFQDVINALVADVAEAQDKATTSVVALGYQAATAGGAYRMILGTHSLRHDGYGVEASLTVDGVAADKTADHRTHVAYESVLGYVADATAEGGMKQVTYTAKELGVEYLSTLTVSDIATTGTSVYTFKTYTYDSEGVKTYGDTIVMTFVDGAFASVAVNPQ